MEPRQTQPGANLPAGGREEVQACFEALRLQQVPLFIQTMDGVEMEARIESLDGAKGRMVLSVPRAPSAGLEADDEVDLFFTMHENRWVGRAKIHYHNNRRNRFTVILPGRLDPCDRRRETRVVLDPSENVMGALSPSGIGQFQVFGRLSNLSENGFRLGVEGAREVASGRLLDPEYIPLKEDQTLDAVQITGLRKAPLEAQGRIVEVDPQPFGAILGIRFKSLQSSDREFLKGFVQDRAVKSSDAQPAPAVEQEIQDAVDHLSDWRSEAPAPVPEPEEPAAASRTGSAALRLKRFKTLALVMPPSPEREALREYLATQGFTRVHPAGTLAELAEFLRKALPDLFIVDWPEPPTAGLAIVHFLGRHPFPSPPKVILSSPLVTTQLAQEANRLGVSHLLIKPYALDGTLVDLCLGMLEGEE